MMASRAEQPPRILDRHVVLPDMHAVGAGRERDIDAVVDEERDAQRPRELLLIARACSTIARVAPCLSRNCNSVAPPAASIAARRGAVAACTLGIDKRIEAKIDGHLKVPLAALT